MKPTKQAEPVITASNGNVFADLGVADPEETLIKAKLALRIRQILEERGLSQTQAAELLGIDQPKISALVRGKLRGFSIDRLFRFLNELGQEVEITVRTSPTLGQRGNARVVMATI